MKNRSFKNISSAVAVVLILSVLLIILMCILPRRLVLDLYDVCRPRLESAIEDVTANDNGSAFPKIENIVKAIEEKEKLLLLFYDHTDVSALEGAAKTALELARTDDPSQLITELCEIGIRFEYLIHLNDISIYNVF